VAVLVGFAGVLLYATAWIAGADEFETPLHRLTCHPRPADEVEAETLLCVSASAVDQARCVFYIETLECSDVAWSVTHLLLGLVLSPLAWLLTWLAAQTVFGTLAWVVRGFLPRR
jgi:hypothetical protein